MTEPTFDITNFIHLLEKNQKRSKGSSQQSPKNQLQSNQLSIIYSMSQPQSSVPDKQNSQHSANKLIQSFKSEDTISQVKTLFHQLKDSGVNKRQIQQINKLQLITFEAIKTADSYQKQIKVLENQFQQQRKGTDQIMQALMKMDEAEKQLWGNYNEVCTRNQNISKSLEHSVEQNKQLKKRIYSYQQDIEFMKKLVLVANQNYQNLEKKYRKIERDYQISQQFRDQKSSPEITSRSTQYKKKSYSPSIKERRTLSGRKKEQFEQNYRKMILRTLKSKAQAK